MAPRKRTSEAASALGKLGGRARARKLSPTRIKAIARQGGLARAKKARKAAREARRKEKLDGKQDHADTAPQRLPA